MARWELAITLDPASKVPLFQQIAEAIARDIARGRLAPDQRMPGSRTLAATLGVHRNTTVAAYETLVAEAWLCARRAGGTFVAPEMPLARPRRFAGEAPGARDTPGFALTPSTLPEGPDPPRGAVSLSDGTPDLRLLPRAALASAWKVALGGHGAPLSYGATRGEPSLRRAVARMVSETRAVAADEDRVLITRGSQMALDLAARALLAAGDVVAVESIGYAPAWRAFERAGAALAPLPVDREGVSVDAFEALVKTHAVRAIYVTPHHQYPTTVALSPSRRVKLLSLAAEHRVAVLEDDYDHEFHYASTPIAPLASADAAGVVIYLGTLSKILAPGLRTGFVVAPRAVIDRLAVERAVTDRQGDRVTERALATLFEEGAVQRHVRRARRIYEARRDACAASLRRHLGDRVRFEVPDGGLSLWVEAPGVDVDAWAARALATGVAVRTGRMFRHDGAASAHVRVGYGQLDEREVDAAIAKLAKAL
ncbi:MAG: PLP-dependent aminotransferase family protein [Polyangiales bacterium]